MTASGVRTLIHVILYLELSAIRNLNGSQGVERLKYFDIYTWYIRGRFFAEDFLIEHTTATTQEKQDGLTSIGSRA